MLKMLESIVEKKGFGATLAKGVMRAAEEIGKGSLEYALHVKGQEVPMHEPRFKKALGVGYAVSPTGADHCHNLHDSLFTGEGKQLDEIKAMFPLKT
jgi:aldehyde:ferredoxin oxidoreductase